MIISVCAFAQGYACYVFYWLPKRTFPPACPFRVNSSSHFPSQADRFSILTAALLDAASHCIL